MPDTPETWPQRVATTIRPDEEVWVDRAEYEQLQALGLLIDPSTARPADSTAAPARPATKTPTEG